MPARGKRNERDQPLAARLRPRHLDEFSGQEHIVGPGRLLRRAIEADQLSLADPSTVRRARARPPWHRSSPIPRASTSSPSTRSWPGSPTSAAPSTRRGSGASSTTSGTILFVDEVHRFNKAQQDALLALGRERHRGPHRRPPPRTPTSRSTAPCSRAAASSSSRALTRSACAASPCRPCPTSAATPTWRWTCVPTPWTTWSTSPTAMPAPCSTPSNWRWKPPRWTSAGAS